MSRLNERQLKNIALLDSLIHRPGRLIIIKALSELDSVDCVELARLTELSWGNLSSHLSRLEKGGYVVQSKSWIGKKPNTTVQLTEQGKRAYLDWGRLILSALPSNMNPELLYNADETGVEVTHPISMPKLPPETAVPKIFWFVPADNRWEITIPPIDNLHQQYS